MTILKAMAIGDDTLLPTAANNTLLVAISFYIELGASYH
jgi:hypothetical protein